MSPPPIRIAVIGGGVSACSFVYGLRDAILSKSVDVSIFEMGRGAGGRAATRGTRDKPSLRLDHGAPAFSAHTPTFAALCDSLVEFNALRRHTDQDGSFGMLKVGGVFEAEATPPPQRYLPAHGKGMSAMCDALLRGDSGGNAMTFNGFGTMVTRVEAATSGADFGGWHLASKKGDDLGLFDWLVVTSTGIAHPRWRTTFGGEPPLVEAAAALGDRHLDATLASLAPLTSKPVIACMLAYETDAAAAWARVPFFKATVEADDTLSRIVVQRIDHDLTSVVLHSTHEFALARASVYGATSTAARVAGAATDKEMEAQVLEAMLVAAEKRLEGLVDPSAIRAISWGPHLHRWGAAFPDAPLLPASKAMVPSARVAFCGDYVDGGDGRAGTLEGAALSGLRAAEALTDALGRGGGGAGCAAM